jgi:hypothetical protein
MVRTIHSAGIRAACLTAAFVLVGSATVPGQTVDETYAFLITEPERDEGVPVLPPNTQGYVGASYEYRDEQIDVFVLVDDEAANEVGWAPSACGDLEFALWEERADRDLIRVIRPDYVLLLSSELDDNTLCLTALQFVDTFEFFLEALESSLSGEMPPEFPAVLEIGAAID